MTHAIRSFTATALLASTVALVDCLPAQLPLGELVVASFAYPGYFPGLGGLFFVNPNTSSVTTVSNMPCELTGACPDPSTPWTGADWVLRLPETGQLVTNGPNWVQQSVDAYVLTLVGSAVSSYVRYPLATFTTSAGLANPAAAHLADGRVLLAIDPTSMGAPGPLAGAMLGILDPTLAPGSPGAVTVVPVSPMPSGMPNALCVDNDRGVAYLAVNSAVYSVPVPAGGPPTLVSAYNGIGINALALEPDGKLLVAGAASSIGRVYRVDPHNQGAVTHFTQSFGSGGVNALCVHPVTGDLWMILGGSGLNQIGRISPRTPTGTLSVVSNGPVGGWGRSAGIDLHSSIETYGAVSGAQPLATWQLAPNAGGTPSVGNVSFTLSNATEPMAPVSVWILGLTSIQLTLPLAQPLELLVAPVTLVSTFNGTPAQPSTLSMPIPANPTLSGMEIYCQCAHFDATGSRASSGVRITIE